MFKFSQPSPVSTTHASVSAEPTMDYPVTPGSDGHPRQEFSDAEDDLDKQDAEFGYDFTDQETRAQLELMDDLQKLGVSKYVDLPQLVVVGDQSTGKSSVLQAVTEIPFSIDDKMCTRFATEIELQRTPPGFPTEIEVCIRPDANDSPERRQELQAWRPSDFDPSGTLDKAMVMRIFQQADEMIFGESSRRSSPGRHTRFTNRLSSSTLKITRKGPKEANFRIVDIPGLVRGDEKNSEHRTAKRLVKKYLDNQRSIVVVVIDVVDLERQEIIEMLKEVQNVESRVIGVINKCDTKQIMSHDWVFELIKNDPKNSSHYLKEGWYGLRNRQASEIGTSDQQRDQKEGEFFSGTEWNALDENKLGRHRLKEALIKMRNRHVKSSIPSLLAEIQSKLEKCEANIKQLGEPRTTNHAQFTLMNKIACEYSQRANDGVNGHYQVSTTDDQLVRGLINKELELFMEDMTKNGLTTPFVTAEQDGAAIARCQPYDKWPKNLISNYPWITSSVKKYRGKEGAGEVNFTAKLQLWQSQISAWETISSRALDRIERTIEKINTSLFEDACPDADLRLKLRAWLQEDSQSAIENAKLELRDLLYSEKNCNLYSLHPYILTHISQSSQARIDALLNHFKTTDPNLTEGPDWDAVVLSVMYRDAELLSVLKMHDSLAAHYQVALYRFVDNFAIQVVERHLLGGRGPLLLFDGSYVAERLYGKEHEGELGELAGEGEVVIKRRKELVSERESLVASRGRVRSFKLL